MKNFIIFVMFVVLTCSCNNQKYSNATSMNEEDFQEYQEQRAQENMIAVETTFVPTLDLTDELRNTSLEQFIITVEKKLSENAPQVTTQPQDIEGTSIYSKMKPTYEYAPSTAVIDDYELKYVPASSNLAKVYYLEDRDKFIKHNAHYFYGVLNKNQGNQEEERRQKNWDKYLK